MVKTVKTEYTETNNEDECRELLRLVPREKINHVFSYPECELEYDFLGFLEVYKPLIQLVPKSMHIIDFGCYQAVQGWYFKDYAKYIGVDNGVENKWRLEIDNAEYYYCSIADFLNNIFPFMGISKEECFAICSYVPSFEQVEMVKEVFPYHRIYYPGRMDYTALTCAQ